MPKKSKKKKGGAGGKKGKKGAKAAAEKEEILIKCRALLKTYQQRCTAVGSTASPSICQSCRESIENERPLVKFVLEPSAPPTRTATAKQRQAQAPSASAVKRPDHEKLPPTHISAVAAPVVSAKPPLLLQPLTTTWVEVKYSYMKVLHIWNMDLSDDAIVSLSLFFESPVGPNLKVLELRDTNLSTWGIKRLAKSLKCSQLSVLNLDYSNILQESMTKLCECLQDIPTLHFLSLDYCSIDSSCCEALGTLAAMSQIKELSLVGNSLECDGCTELMRPLVTICESSIDEAAALAELTQTSEDQPDGELEVPKKQPHPPSPLVKLFLQDNGIDVCGVGSEYGSGPDDVFEPQSKGLFASIVCMRAIKRWILSSPPLEEINLDGNNIGDGAGRELMLALQERKEAGLPPIRMTVSPRVCPDIYEVIIELSVSFGKKAGKKKGKKKKKK